MYEVDPNVNSLRGKRVETFLDLKKDAKNVTYLQGNADIFHQYLIKKEKIQSPRVAFFGD